MNLRDAFVCGLALLWPSFSTAQTPTPAPPPVPSVSLHRQYRDGEKLIYHMKGVNEAWHYEIDAQGEVKQDAKGHFVEEYQWTNMISDGQPVALAASAADYRQKLSLDSRQIPSAPDLQKADPKIIGPITDLMTFYSDLWLANVLGGMKKTGDHFYFKNPMIPSWADGTHVLLGQDAIDFDMTLKAVDFPAGIAILEVRHVPPKHSALQLKAAWMQEPVGAGTNNWVQIERDTNGKYVAAVGVETFTVDITVSLTDGHIVRAQMENPVTTIERVCEDEALTTCGDAKRHEILRKIEIEQKQ